MTEQDWTVLLGRIRSGKCTPFLGAGVNYGILPLGGEIAGDWAKEEHFPLRGSDDLASVAQFIAVKYNDNVEPKGRILRRLQQAARPDFSQLDPRLDCLQALAELPLPVYMTSNYRPGPPACQEEPTARNLPLERGLEEKYSLRL